MVMYCYANIAFAYDNILRRYSANMSTTTLCMYTMLIHATQTRNVTLYPIPLFARARLVINMPTLLTVVKMSGTRGDIIVIPKSFDPYL